jgi:subtilisin family serine protease
MMKRSAVAIGFALLIYGSHSPAEAAVASKLRLGQARSNFYAVVLADQAVAKAGGTEKALERLEARLVDRGAQIVARFERVFRGFVVYSTESGVPRKAAALVDVEYVERLGQIGPSAQQLNPLNWGLDRIDQVNLPYDNSYSYNTTGAGVHLFIVDSGVQFSHPEFAGRTPLGWDAWDALIDVPGLVEDDGESFDSDCLLTRSSLPPFVWTLTGHGTQVAAIAAGTTVGVAKQAILHSMKIWSCNFNQSQSQPTQYDGEVAHVVASMAAFEYIATSPHLRPAVVNYSYNSNDGYQPIFATTVQNLINTGVTFVWSAGNQEGVTGVPVGTAITVGATTQSDRRLGGTCYGGDLYAPGAGQVTADPKGGYTSFSFTSAAAPHVAGAAARYLQTHPTATPAQVKNHLLSTATPNKVTNVPFWGGSKSLLYVAP